MVLNKTSQCQTIVTKRESLAIFLTLLAVFVASITLISALIVKGFLGSQPEEDEGDGSDTTIEVIEDVDEPPVVVLPEKIDFQGIVDEWANSIEGNRSVLIYDIERDEVVGEYKADESYSTASLYKLFVVYEGYRRLASSEWSPEDIAGSTGYDIKTCLDLAIRESYSPCAETLWAMIGHTELDDIVATDFRIINSDISHLVSNPRDILKIMMLFYKHDLPLSEDLVASMKDSFLNQPITTYNWRQGLPSGFSRANVYNKVGWDYNGSYWTIYHDSAIVEFPEDNRHFVVIVMTNRVPFSKIKNFGTQLEEFYYNQSESNN